MPPEKNSLYEANLGCATTEELLLELIARFTVHYPHDSVESMQMTTRAVTLGIMLGGLSSTLKEYRTVDN